MLVVFDLDLTLWNCGGTWCDATTPPYSTRNEVIYDSLGAKITLLPGAEEILEDLKKRQITLALASRTGAPDWARELLCLFGIEHYFDYMEIYPGSKTTHFARLAQKSGIAFENMLFFDDEYRNIEEVSQLGVECIFTPEGINKKLIESALEVMVKNKE